MAKILQLAVIFLFLSVAFGFDIISSQDSYTDPSEKILLSCEHYEWKKDVVIKFFKDKEMIYNSADPNFKSQYVSGIKDHNQIILNNAKTKGWEKMSCTINDLPSANILNVPYVENFIFNHDPDNYKIGRMFTLSCNGQMYPDIVNVTYSFRFQNLEIASITNGVVTQGNAPNFNVITNRVGDNWLKMTPETNDLYGEYFCEMIFQASATKKGEAVSNGWTVVRPVEPTAPTVPAPTETPTTETPTTETPTTETPTTETPTTDSPNNRDKTGFQNSSSSTSGAVLVVLLAAVSALIANFY